MKNIYVIQFHEDMSSCMKSSDITIQNKGLYISDKKYNEKLSFDLTLNTPTSQEIKDKSFYRYPNLTLPRMKVDVLKEKHNVKILRDKDKADYRIISYIHMTNLCEFIWGKCITVSVLIKNLIDKGYKQDIIDCFVGLPQDDMITLSNKYYIHNKHSDYIMFNDIFDYSKVTAYCFVDLKNISEYLEILNATNLIKDSHIVSLCNEDSVIITGEEYRTMQKMIKSGDKENVTLALEMIANCNLESSFDYVSLIYYFLYERLKDASNWNNVNVKTLRKRLSEFTPWGNNQTGSTYNNYLLKLIEEDKLTEFAFKETARYAFHNVIKTAMGLNHEGDKVFTIELDSIKLNPEYKNKLKTTIVDNTFLII